MAERTLTADRGDGGRRLDLVLRRHLAGVEGTTRTRIQRWIETGRVTINTIAVHKPATNVSLADIVTVTLPDTRLRRAMDPENLPLDVVYEDDYLLALNKAAGIVVHPTHAHFTGTVMNGLLWRARGWPAPQRPTLVGRLDKLTSGLVVVAKTRAIHAALQRTLTSRASEKDYLAVVYGRVSVARGRIDSPLGRDPSDRRRVVIYDAGAPSETRFERLARIGAPHAGLALLRCRLLTGRMHQIRVHLAARGWPIVGDAKYGEARWRTVADPELCARLRAFPRQALHAWRVTFTHPATRDRLRIEARVPADLQDLIDVVRRTST
jgi:23S rRNA pseudouridine1911/1915/1917 synthase